MADAPGDGSEAPRQLEIDAVADKRVEFLIEEYKSLKTEVFSLVADSRHVETFTGAAVAAVTAWLATHAVGSTLVWYIPVVLSALGFVRAIGLYKKLQLAGQYLRATEQAFLAATRPNGWEHYLKSRGGFWVSGSSALYWVALIVVSLLAPSYLPAPSIVDSEKPSVVIVNQSGAGPAGGSAP